MSTEKPSEKRRLSTPKKVLIGLGLAGLAAVAAKRYGNPVEYVQQGLEADAHRKELQEVFQLKCFLIENQNAFRAALNPKAAEENPGRAVRSLGQVLHKIDEGIVILDKLGQSKVRFNAAKLAQANQTITAFQNTLQNEGLQKLHEWAATFEKGGAISWGISKFKGEAYLREVVRLSKMVKSLQKKLETGKALLGAIADETIKTEASNNFAVNRFLKEQAGKVQCLSKKGDSNDEVRKAQDALKALGYLETEPDGSFGKQTVQAVQAFREREAIAVSKSEPAGAIGEKTRERLNELLAEKKKQPADGGAR